MLGVDGMPAGALLASLRKQARLTQSQAAQTVNLSQPHYSRVEARGSLGTAQWRELRPMVALGIFVPDPPPPSEIVDVVCWPLDGKLTYAVFPSIGDELALFADPDVARCAAASLSIFGLTGTCAVPVTRLFVETDLLFRVGGLRRTYVIPGSREDEPAAHQKGLQFAADAFARVVSERRIRGDRPGFTQTLRSSRLVWDGSRLSAQI